MVHALGPEAALQVSQGDGRVLVFQKNSYEFTEG